jgi:O-antigen/teichoic acid export membrane protein
LARNAFLPTLGLTILCGLALAVAGGPFIRFLFSDRFSAAYLPMVALLPGAAMLGSAKVLSNNLAGRGFPHYNAIVSGTSLVVTITGDLLLIPRWGVLGASIASSLAYAVTLILTMFFFRRASTKSS